jgi:hypothetical protein
VKRRRMRAYLSGGMEYAKGEGADWRDKLERWIRTTLGHDVFNPNVESQRFLSRHGIRASFRKLKKSDTGRYREIVTSIVALDSREIAKRSDYVICYWDRSAQRGAGTKGELTLARYFGKPVLLVTRVSAKNIPGWVLGCTTNFFDSFSALKSYLVRHGVKRTRARSRNAS